MLLTNTLLRRPTEFVPLVDRTVSMYTCGPTVYNFAHIGNFRAMMAYDLLKRWLRCAGYAVTHVMNITDIDDKTIRGAHTEGIGLAAFTARYTHAFMEDCATLRMAPADVFPKATAHIPQMIALVQTLMDKGVAYRGTDGSVYFSIDKFRPYGALSRLDSRELMHGARIASDEYDKLHAADFALWKAWSPDDGDVKWPSPWGDGRPGWHLECSVMAREYLGDTLDIHMGGEDLVFPHHENEIAQSEAATGKPFARFWIHNAHLLVDGRKMSKSLGNYYTLRDIVAKGWTGREIRYLLLSAHYRQPLNFTFEGLHAARSALQRLDESRRQLVACDAQGTLRDHVKAALELARQTWSDSLNDDLNISPALAGLFELVHQANKWLVAGGMTKADAVALLDFLDQTDAVLALAGSDDAVPADIQQLALDRAAARKAKEFTRADDLRAQLAARGYTVEDTASGPRVKKA